MHFTAAIRVVGKGRYMIGRGHGNRQFQKALLHLHNSYFLYLTLFL